MRRFSSYLEVEFLDTRCNQQQIANYQTAIDAILI